MQINEAFKRKFERSNICRIYTYAIRLNGAFLFIIIDGTYDHPKLKEIHKILFGLKKTAYYFLACQMVVTQK